jgi:hypothetical protein
MITIEAEGGQDICSFVKQLVAVARRTGLRTAGAFNEHTLIADPSSTEASVFEQWDAPVRRSYFGDSAKFGTRSN